MTDTKAAEVTAIAAVAATTTIEVPLSTEATALEVAHHPQASLVLPTG